MKQLWFLPLCLLLQNESLLSLTVTDVKVSVTSDSAASAREKALADAHGLAFQQLLKEHFPESSPSLPPQDTLMNMVSDFSINKEKTTPQSYTASLTFQFDEPQVQAWLHQAQPPSSSPMAFTPSPTGDLLKITAAYDTLAQWHHIKKTLEGVDEVQKLRLISLSPTKAEMEVAYTGEKSQLQQRLRDKKLSLEPQGQGWEISAYVPKIVR
jgi:hypothetical protein